MKILFICRHNRFRSKSAEAIFNKLNKNKKVKAESAGFLLDEAHLYIEKSVLNILKDKGYSAKGLPRQLTRELLDKFDVLVIVADNIDPAFFQDFKGKLIHWKVPDCSCEDIPRIKEIIEDIEKRVKLFVKRGMLMD